MKLEMSEFREMQDQVSSKKDELGIIWGSIGWAAKERIAKQFGAPPSISAQELARYFPDMAIYLLGRLACSLI